MRNAFLDTLYALALNDKRINLIVGDLGFSVVERFAESIPGQFLNAGIAEQNMTGVAAGMAMMGKKVFTYSIANFPTLRCLEQIRNDVCYHKADVKIVSVGAGFAYGCLGVSHHATEDVAVMRAIPEMRVIAPADPVETVLATRALAADDAPCYLRLGKAGETALHQCEFDFKIGKAATLRNGSDVTIIGSGSILKCCMEAADMLAKEGISARVLSMHTIKPLDTEAVDKASEETRAIITVEEHSARGGLGGAVAEHIASNGLRARLGIMGLPNTFFREAGSQDFLRDVAGISARHIAGKVNALFKDKK